MRDRLYFARITLLLSMIAAGALLSVYGNKEFNKLDLAIGRLEQSVNRVSAEFSGLKSEVKKARENVEYIEENLQYFQTPLKILPLEH